MTVSEQLRLVFQEWRLTPRESLCISCGGRLEPVDKRAVRDRIPSRTWRWLDDYFLCAGCGRLFWHGTHWHRIQQTLARCAAEGDLGGGAMERELGPGQG